MPRRHYRCKLETKNPPCRQNGQLLPFPRHGFIRACPGARCQLSQEPGHVSDSVRLRVRAVPYRVDDPPGLTQYQKLLATTTSRDYPFPPMGKRTKTGG